MYVQHMHIHRYSLPEKVVLINTFHIHWGENAHFPKDEKCRLFSFILYICHKLYLVFICIHWFLQFEIFHVFFSRASFSRPCLIYLLGRSPIFLMAIRTLFYIIKKVNLYCLMRMFFNFVIFRLFLKCICRAARVASAV